MFENISLLDNSQHKIKIKLIMKVLLLIIMGAIFIQESNCYCCPRQVRKNWKLRKEIREREKINLLPSALCLYNDFFLFFGASGAFSSALSVRHKEVRKWGEPSSQPSLGHFCLALNVHNLHKHKDGHNFAVKVREASKDIWQIWHSI